MRRAPMVLKWNETDVPHAILDIGRGCNISCKACYNAAPQYFKPLEQVCSELDALMSLRKLESVSIMGGEPLLHPELIKIIREVKKRDLHVILFSNGLLLDNILLRTLNEAGVDSIFLHIEKEQIRPDLQDPRSSSHVKELMARKIGEISEYGMLAGLVFTAFKDDASGMIETLKFALECPSVEYVLITLYRNMQEMGAITGNIKTGLSGDPANRKPDPDGKYLTLDDIGSLMIGTFGLHPFAVLPSNKDDLKNRWFSYLIGRVFTKHGLQHYGGLSSSMFEPVFIKTHKMFHGRYPFFQRYNSLGFVLHLFFNAIAGGSCRTNCGIAGRSLSRLRLPKSLRIVFQSPAELQSDGTVLHCQNCPDAVLVNDGLVPVCLSAQVRS